MSLDEIRRLLASHQTDSATLALAALIDVVGAQELQIGTLLDAQFSSEQRYQRRMTDLQRQIDRLKGVHGA